MFNWKSNLDKESNSVLFDLFSETNRINLEPQLYAGNLLFVREYKIESLVKAKTDLIEAIEESGLQKYHLDNKKIAKETIIRELFFKILLSIIIFLSFYQGLEFHYEIGTITVDNETIAWLLGLITYVPLIRIRSTIQKAITKVEKSLAEKENMIQKINVELIF